MPFATQKNVNSIIILIFYQVDSVDIEGKTCIDVPSYGKPVEFGMMFDFSYPVENSGKYML